MHVDELREMDAEKHREANQAAGPDQDARHNLFLTLSETPGLAIPCRKAQPNQAEPFAPKNCFFA